MKKQDEYAVKLLAHIREIFNEESEHYISLEELGEGNNATDFIHALANLAPNLVYRCITNDELNTLEFNHLANKLAFQYSKSDK